MFKNKLHWTLPRALCLLFSPLVYSADAYDPVIADAEILDAKIATKALFTDVVATDTGAVAVGERGHILKSSNLNDWVQLPVPTRSLLTNVYAHGTHLWAVGHEEVILHSSDSGSTWERQHASPDAFGPLLDILFIDDANGFAIGAEGKMLTTSDSGKNWLDGVITTRTNVPASKTTAAIVADDGLASDDIGVDETPPHLNAIVQNKLGLLIVGETGAAYNSVDSGKSWTRLAFPYSGPMFGAVVLDDDSIIAFGLSGHLYQTHDLGKNWVKLETNTEATLFGAVAVKGARAVFVGARGTFLTKDADSTVLKNFTFGDGGMLGGVLQRGGTDFTVVGENGILAYSPK
jgi:photosystem II stability/assembly factor-like uncharacterized protein